MITLTAKITKLDGSYIVLDHRNILSLERQFFDRKDISLPSWGVISNGGNIRFVDRNGEVKKLAEQRLLKSGMRVEFFLNNTNLNKTQNIGVFFTTDWDYDNDNKTVSVTINDDLQQWQDIGITPSEKSLYKFLVADNVYYSEIYIYLKSLTPDKYNMLAFELLDYETQEQLKRRKATYNYHTNTTLWSAWNDFAIASQTHILKDDNGNTITKYHGGN